MGQTDLWDIRYPESADENDVPTDIAELAADVEAGLGRAFRCTSSTRPASPGNDMIIRETDTGNVLIWSGSSWGLISGGGGGGGGSTGGGRWAGSASQPVLNTTSGLGTVVAFPDEVGGTPTLVTRSTLDTGHKFALTTSGLWACGATVRVQNSPAAGEISAAIWADPDGGGYDVNVAQMGGLREGLPRTFCLSRTTYLAAGTSVAVYVYNGTGTTRTLEPAGGAWVNLDLRLVA